MQTLRRRVLDMAHVEVETSAVEEKSSVSRRFLVVAVMQIDRASVRLSEEIVLNLRRPQLRIYMRFVFSQKTAVFGFDSNNPIHRPTNAPNRDLVKRKIFPSPWSFPQPGRGGSVGAKVERVVLNALATIPEIFRTDILAPSATVLYGAKVSPSNATTSTCPFQRLPPRW